MPRIKKATAAAQRATTPTTSQDEPEVTDGRKGRGVVRDKVLKYIEKASGTTVYVDDMAKDLGLTDQQIRGAVRGLIDGGTCPQIVVVIGGRAWRWDASASKAISSKRLYEELTTTKAGVVLVQDEDGNVYKLEEL